MGVSNWVSNCRRWMAQPSRRSQLARRAPRAPVRCGLAVEKLEDRIAPDGRTFAGLEFLAANNFTNSGTQIAVTGPVQVGLAPTSGGSFSPLLKLDGGVQFDAGDATGAFMTPGSVEAVVAGLDVPLLGNSPHTLSGTAITGLAGFTLPSSDTNNPEVSVAGVDFSLSNIGFTSAGIDLQGVITVPGLAGLSLAVTGANHLLIDSGGVHLSGVNASITTPETLNVAGLSLTVQHLAVGYTAASDTFQVSGSGTLSLLGKTFSITLGSGQQPGLVIQNGAIARFSFALSNTNSISVAGITLTPQLLGAAYTQSTDTLTIAGSASLSVGSIINKATINLGGNSTPGIVIQHGKLQSFDGSITAKAIAIAGVGFSNVSLAVDYQADTKDLALSGAATFAVPGTAYKVAVALGSTDSPGVAIINGQLTELNFSIAADSKFNIAGVTIDPKSLAVSYAQSTNTFKIDGEALFSVGTAIQDVDIALGDANNHGIVIVAGKLQSLHASVSGAINVLGATFHTEGLTVSYRSGNVAIYGSAGFAIGPDILTADLGGSDDPGIVIAGGTLQSLNIGLTGDFDLFGFRVSTDDLTVKYDAPHGELELSGGIGIALSSVISGKVTLSEGGLLIDTHTGALSINAATGLSLEGDMKVGPFDATVDISYSDTDGKIDLSASASVRFPGNIAVAATLDIVNNQLSAISFAYDDSSPGIALGDSGLFITKVTGALDHLDDPSNVSFSGSVTVVAGDTLTIAGKHINLLSMTGTVTVTPQEFDLDGTLTMLGGYVGASASAELSLNWATGVYQISGTESLCDGIFTLTESLTLTNHGDITVMAQASVNVPSGLPGAVYTLLHTSPGQSLGALDFYLQVRPHQALSHTYAMAWLDVGGIGDVGLKVALGGNPLTISGFVSGPLVKDAITAYHTVVGAAAQGWHAIGDTADDVADALQKGYHVAAKDGAIALEGAGYAVRKIGTAMHDVYHLADTAAAKALKGAGYAVTQVTHVLTSIYQDAAQDVGAALAAAGYALNDVVNVLHTVFQQTAQEIVTAVAGALHATAQELTQALHDAGYLAHDAAAAVSSAFGTAAADMVSFLHTAGYALNDIAGVLNTAFGQAAAEAGKILSTISSDVTLVGSALVTAFGLLDVDLMSALQAAGYDAAHVAQALKATFQTGAEQFVLFAKSLSYDANQAAAALQSVYHSAVNDVHHILTDAEFALTDVARALNQVYRQTAQQIASVLLVASHTIDEVGAALRDGLSLGANDVLGAVHGAALQVIITGQNIALKLSVLGTSFEQAAQAGAQLEQFIVNAALKVHLASMLQNVFSMGLTDLASAFKSVLGATDSVVATMVRDLGHSAQEVADVLNTVFQDSAKTTATILHGLDFATSEVAAALGQAYQLSDSAVGAVMHAAGWAKSDLEKLGDTFVKGWDTVKRFFSNLF